MAEAAVERQQLVTRGYTDRQLLEQQAQAEAARNERIAELEAELERIDPRRRAARAAESQRMAAGAKIEDTLRRARSVDRDGSMSRRVAELDHRQELQRHQAAQAEIDRAEAEIVRSGNY